jgi:hypothetical protein
VPPTAYRLQFHLASTADPLSATPLLETPDLLVTSVCNQAALTTVPPAVVVDPMTWVWTDPVDPLKTCRTNQATFITANLPAAGSASMAGYVTTIVAVGGGMQSLRLRATNAFSTTNGPPPPGGKFVLGQTVTPVIEVAYVFDTPSGAMIGSQPLGASGTVTAGPLIRVQGTAMLTVWQVDFTTGVDGWVWEDRLIAVAGVAHPAPTGVGIRR